MQRHLITPHHLAPCQSSIGPRLLPRRSQGQHARIRCPTVCVSDVDTAQFETEVLKSDKPVLVDFWAQWCGPCKLMSPLMDWTEKEYPHLKVVKVEHDKNPALIERYKVYGLPALLLFKDGEEVPGSKREGAVTKPMLLTYLKQHKMVEA